MLQRSSETGERLLSLGEARRGDRGVIAAVTVAEGEAHGVPAEELVRRLLEFGLVEGAQVRVLHEGLIGRDPLVLQVDDMRVALRRREARALLLRCESTR